MSEEVSESEQEEEKEVEHLTLEQPQAVDNLRQLSDFLGSAMQPYDLQLGPASALPAPHEPEEEKQGGAAGSARASRWWTGLDLSSSSCSCPGVSCQWVMLIFRPPPNP